MQVRNGISIMHQQKVLGIRSLQKSGATESWKITGEEAEAEGVFELYLAMVEQHRQGQFGTPVARGVRQS